MFTSDPDFPFDLMDHFAQQAEVTVNLLRASAATPCISAYHQVQGVYDYAANPFAPMGTKVLIHERCANRGTWSSHGSEGWYFRPKLDTYRSHIVFVISTGGVRVSNTLAWHPVAFVMPDFTGIEALATLTAELTHTFNILQEHPPSWFASPKLWEKRCKH
jgi:hypothetical protein